MEKDITFTLIGEIYQKDSTGQNIPTPTETECVGTESSVYQNEFFAADQAGIRSQGVIKMNVADYNGEKLLSINGQEFSIYRTYERDADWIELYYGRRVGNG